MNKKWSPGKVKQTEKWLRIKWPELFVPGPDLKPLSTSIYKDILAYRSENEDLSGRALREALKRHTTSFGYLYGMMKNTHRVGLDGKPVEPIQAEHRAWASRMLRLLQKISKKTRKPSGNRRGPDKGVTVAARALSVSKAPGMWSLRKNTHPDQTDELSYLKAAVH